MTSQINENAKVIDIEDESSSNGGLEKPAFGGEKVLDEHDLNAKDKTLQQPSNNGFSAKWSNAINKVHIPILAGLQGLTQLSAHNPKRTMSFIAFLSILLAVVGVMTNFNVDVDEDKLWTPADSLPIKHSDWIDNDSGFPSDTHDLILFFHYDGDNVLGKDEVAQVFETLDAILAIDGYEAVCSESTYLDSNNKTTCEIDGIVNFWNRSSSIFENQVSTDEDAVLAMSALYFPDGTRVSENSIFGYPERNEDDGNLTKATSYSVAIRLPPTDAAEDFEDDAIDILLDMRGNGPMSFEFIADGSFGDEFQRAIVNDIPLIPIVFIIMSCFTALVFFKRDKVQSRSLLGFGATVAVILSLISGFGLLFICGVPFTSMTQIAPFVLVGVGLDDAFIIFGSYSRTDPNKETTERIRETIDDVGISITLTTMTSTLAFGLGCLSSIPAVYWLCYYCFPSLVFIYFYQLTFFISWIVLDERRIKANKRDCCVCITVEKDDEDDEAATEDGTTSGSGDQPSMKESFIDSFMESYAKFLLQPIVKVLVIITFIGLACACAWSASNHTQEFSFTEVMPDDSYVVDFFNAFDEYTVRGSIAPFAYFRFVDQSDTDIQSQMEEYVDELVAMDAVEEKPEFFWLWDFKEFVNDENLEDLSFNEQVESFLSNTVYYDLYNDHIVRNSTGHITSSRVKINFDNVDEEDVNQQIDTLEEQRYVTSRQPINQGKSDWPFFSYDGIYNIWEFYSVSVDELIFTTIMGVVAVTGVALIFIPHWTAALFVLPMIALLYVDLLGVMQWAGVHINAVSYITLVMSIGLLVDFIMHVLLRYYECPGNRREKTILMLKTMGSSILIGGVSTFLGTLPLAFSTSTIFFTIFIAFVGLVTLGIGHGLILLPVVLSIIGPEDQIPLPKSSASTGTKDLDASVRTRTLGEKGVSSDVLRDEH